MANPRKTAKEAAKATRLPFTGKNYALLAIGLVLILLGFVVLSTGEITISPLLLFLGYCVFIPAGILLKSRRKETDKKPKGE